MSVKLSEPFQSQSLQPPLQPQSLGNSSRAGQRWRRFLPRMLSVLTVIWGMGVTTPTLAAERVTLRVGPFAPSVAIADLEHFAATGEATSSLKPYTALLTSDVQQALNSSLQLDSTVSDKIIEDLIRSLAGQRFLNALQVAIPNSNTDKLKTALSQAAQQSDLSLLGFLRAFPDENVTIDGTSAIALASQVNLPFWQSQALGSILRRELTVQDTQPIESSIDPTDFGNQWVRQQTLTFRDYRRDRSIPVDLYWSRRSQGPLIIMSHGFGADRRFLSYLAYHLASHGFTVAALEHPRSNVAWLTRLSAGIPANGRFGDVLPATEFIDRPQDISFLLDELEKLNRYSTLLRDKFNTQEVTVIGHSLGGSTAFALAGAELNLAHLRQICSNPKPIGLSAADWLQCTAADLPDSSKINLKDDRVAQIITFNPVIGQLFDTTSLSHLQVPLLLLSGTNDAITPAVSQQLLPFTQLTGSKYLLTAIGATHLSVGDPANLNHALTQSLFIRELPGDETESLRSLIKGVTLAFVKQTTPDAKTYHPFLTADYAQSFSTPEITLTLNAELPDKLSNWLTVAALPLEQIVSNTLPPQRDRLTAGTSCHFDVRCLVNRLPLVMFILPGNLLWATIPLIKLRRYSKRW